MEFIIGDFDPIFGLCFFILVWLCYYKLSIFFSFSLINQQMVDFYGFINLILHIFK